MLDSEVIRPLLNMSKQEILGYAKLHDLQWREDSTNASDNYLRNRVRRKTDKLSSDEKRQLLSLRSHQIHSKKLIDNEVLKLVGGGPNYSRYFFTHTNETTAIECLRSVMFAKLTRPQLKRLLLAIKTSKSGSVYQAGNGLQITFTSRNFTVELIK